MMKNNNALFYTCSLIEYIGRKVKLERSELVSILGKDFIKRIYKDSDALHCEPIEKIAEEIIDMKNITNGSFDNIAACRYEVPDYWTIGEVYERLIEDICDENNDIDFITETLLHVYTSWISKAISNYNTDFFYQSRQYIYECWKEGEVIQEAG